MPEWYEEHGIEFIKGKATSVDLKTKCVLVGDQEVHYDKLILATGCCAVRLRRFGMAGDDFDNVHYLREEADAAKLVRDLEAAQASGGEVVVLGGGYVGLEAAAAIVGWGLKTTVIFPGGHVMPRFFGKELATWLEDQYASRGVTLLRSDRCAEFLGKDGKLQGIRLQSGREVSCSIAVVGVGAAPNVEFCQGLAMKHGGFAVDVHMRTSDPNVFAVGDICAFPSSLHGGEFVRCEHVDHARKSAAHAVKAAMGSTTEPYRFAPFFYSRLFEYSDNPVVFNFYGSQDGTGEVITRSADSRGCVWIKDGKAVGALLLGSPGPTADDAKKLMQIANETPLAQNAAAAFAAVGL